MIVFDLQCGEGHVFEAWFGSSEDFADQQARNLVSCPLCGDQRIEKAVMAPAVAPKANSDRALARRKDELRRLAEMQAEIEARCDYVGDRFAEEARRRHADPDAEPDGRGIYGETTISAAMDLVAEGIPVAPLPFRTRRRADA